MNCDVMNCGDPGDPPERPPLATSHRIGPGASRRREF